MGRRTRFIKALLLALFLLILISVPVLAYGTLTPTSIDVLSSKQFPNVLQPNDLLVVFRYSLAYISPPSETADTIFIFSLLNSDTGLEYGSVTPYPYTTLGYGQGMSALYFDNATAPSLGIPIEIRIMGNPAPFTEAAEECPVEYFPIINNCTETTQPAISTAIGNYIFEQTHQLEIVWDTPLIVVSGGSNTLTTAGEVYLSSAIPGLAVFASQIMAIQTISSAPPGASHGNELAENLTTQYGGTWVQDAIDGMGDTFGTSGLFITGLIVLGCSVAFIIVSKNKLGHIEPGLIASCLLFIGAAKCGFVHPAVIMTTALLFGIYLAYILIFRNA